MLILLYLLDSRSRLQKITNNRHVFSFYNDNICKRRQSFNKKKGRKRKGFSKGK